LRASSPPRSRRRRPRRRSNAWRGRRRSYVLTVAPLGPELAMFGRPLAMVLVADPDERSLSRNGTWRNYSTCHRARPGLHSRSCQGSGRFRRPDLDGADPAQLGPTKSGRGTAGRPLRRALQPPVSGSRIEVTSVVVRLHGRNTPSPGTAGAPPGGTVASVVVARSLGRARDPIVRPTAPCVPATAFPSSRTPRRVDPTISFPPPSERPPCAYANFHIAGTLGARANLN
jgi:hypothetical protein